MKMRWIEALRIGLAVLDLLEETLSGLTTGQEVDTETPPVPIKWKGSRIWISLRIRTQGKLRLEVKDDNN